MALYCRPTTMTTETIDPIATAIHRYQQGQRAVPHAPAFEAWVARNPGSWRGLIAGLEDARTGHIDFRTPDSAVAKASASMDREAAISAYNALQQTAGFDMGVGNWMEQRCVYQSSNYESTRLPGAMRDCHLGLDVFAPAGTPLYLPLAGEVMVAEVRDMQLDYGGMLVLRHSGDAHPDFYTIWGHLSHASARRWQPGDRIAAGTAFAHLGDFAENGWWLPHLHLQLCLITLPDFADAPGAGESAYAEVWQDIFPNPAPLLGLA
jgi:murein DD-endopeptidase MepM/ murein hydrolase activator NlpD